MLGKTQVMGKDFICLEINMIFYLINVKSEHSRGWSQPPDLAALAQLSAGNVGTALSLNDSPAEAVEVLLVLRKLLDICSRQSRN